ncbi:MAG: VWA domain-containing protein [Gammaproteobacteria bacterium]|nr:VWA domain-containing protein [Gammaproteobacteria bacterium]
MMNTHLSRILKSLLMTSALHAAVVFAVPQDLLLVLDNSGSMRQSDPARIAKNAIAKMLAKLPADTRAGVLIFDESVRLAVPLTEVTDTTRAKFASGLNRINYRGQLTDIPTAIERALSELETNGRAGVAKSIVFMTDGIVDTGDKARDLDRTKALREVIVAGATAKHIKIYDIGLTADADHELLQELAARSGGEYFRALKADELPPVFAEINARLAAIPPATTESVAPLPTAPEAPAALPAEPAAPPAVVTPTPPAEEPAAAESSAPPEPVVAAPVEPAAPAMPPTAPAAPATGDEKVPLSAEERASLEELAKQTGVPVEQLIKEMESAPAGKAVIVRPENATTPAAPPAVSMRLVGGAALVAALAALGVWFARRKKQVPATPEPVVSAAPAKPRDVEAFLIDVHGLTAEGARKLGEKPVMIGRTAGTDTDYLDYFVVNKATIGRRHAVIKQKDLGFWLVDQGSVNGTYVNNERVLGERQLKHGDRVKFHKFEFEFSYPAMADSSRTVVGISPDQTIVAAQDATVAATTTALQNDGLSSTIARAGAASATATAAWLNKDALHTAAGAVPPTDELDFTAADGDMDALENDKEAFFEGSGPHSAYPAPAVAEGDDTFDDERSAATQVLDRLPLDEEDYAEPATAASALDADAAAFFDDNTVGPAPDLMKGPRPDSNTDLDVLDITRVSGLGDDDSTSNFVPPTVVFDHHAAAASGTQPGLGTGTFGALTTVARDDLDRTDPSEAPTFVPERPDRVMSDPPSERFTQSAVFENKERVDEEASLKTGPLVDDIFDVTGSSGDIPNQDTVVMNKSPLHVPDSGNKPPDKRS